MDKNSDSWFDEKNKLIINMSESVDENSRYLDEIFTDCGDIVKKIFWLNREGKKVKILIVYVDGLTDNEMIETKIVKPLSYEWRGAPKGDLWSSIYYAQVQTADIKEETSFDETILSVLKGDTAVFIDGYDKTMIVSSKKLPLRGISENETEATLRGPKDSFNEGLRQSTALVRRRIRDPRLKVHQGVLGVRSRTDYAIMYLEDVAPSDLVVQIKERLNKYEIDGIFDSGMAEHLLEDGKFSLFPMFQSTTRPDKVASGILEGRVAIVFDNSPEVIIAPSSINMLLQSADDYYNSWAVGTFARILRYIAVFIAISLPGLYIAITVFHSEMIPSKLLYAIVSARSMVTFPIIVEVLIMEFFFELLREAGIRLPGPLGNTIGVVGGLIVGQAAVDAGIVSTIVVIVVALTAIASFTIPNEEFASVFRLLKFFTILVSAIWGMFGYILSLLLVAIYLSGQDSFGLPYLYPSVAREEYKSLEDYILRAPIKYMRRRPVWANKKNITRLVRNDNDKFSE